MRTGIEVVEGFLVFSPPDVAVPKPFWKKLRVLVNAAGLTDEMVADYRATKEHVHTQRRESLWWGTSEEMELERQFFRKWVEKVAPAPSLWPWSRGWTQAYADTYLDPIATPRGKEAAQEAGNDRGRAEDEARGSDQADPGVARNGAAAVASRGPRTAAAILGAMRTGGQR